jgi:hypothetical protein
VQPTQSGKGCQNPLEGSDPTRTADVLLEGLGGPGGSGMALLAGRKILLMMASGIAPLHAHFGQVNRPLCRQRIKRMRRVAVAAFGNVRLLFRTVRHISMGTGLFPAGRHVLGGSFDEFVKGAVAAKALVLCCAQNPGANQNADTNEGQSNPHALPYRKERLRLARRKILGPGDSRRDARCG